MRLRMKTQVRSSFCARPHEIYITSPVRTPVLKLTGRPRRVCRGKLEHRSRRRHLCFRRCVGEQLRMSSGVHALSSGVDNSYTRIPVSRRRVCGDGVRGCSQTHVCVTGVLLGVCESTSSGACESCMQIVYSALKRLSTGLWVRSGCRGVCGRLLCWWPPTARVRCARAAPVVGILYRGRYGVH